MNIPHDMVDGRPIFHKARHRDLAAALVELPDPVHEGMDFSIRDPLCRARSGQFHWAHSKCVRTSFMKWTRYTRAMVLDGSRFMETDPRDCCPACRAEFENA